MIFKNLCSHTYNIKDCNELYLYILSKVEINAIFVDGSSELVMNTDKPLINQETQNSPETDTELNEMIASFYTKMEIINHE